MCRLEIAGNFFREEAIEKYKDIKNNEQLIKSYVRKNLMKYIEHVYQETIKGRAK